MKLITELLPNAPAILTTKLSTPQNLVATKVNNEVNLTWEQPEDTSLIGEIEVFVNEIGAVDESGKVKGLTIVAILAPDATSTLVTPAALEGAGFAPFTAGKMYQFAVQNYNGKKPLIEEDSDLSNIALAGF